MPIHFEDLDVLAEIAGCSTALIVPCNMCPAVTVAVREEKPFMQLFRSFLKSPPFEEYLAALQCRLRDVGVSSKVFRSHLYHHWFMCMWTASRHKKLRREAESYDAVVVLGCKSATVSVRDAIGSLECKVIEGMKVTGIMNAKLVLSPLGNISFAEHKTIPISREPGAIYKHPEDSEVGKVPGACLPGAVLGCLH